MSKSKSHNYNEEYYLRLSQEFDISYSVIRAVVESQFEVVKKTIKEFNREDPTTHKNIRLRHLGLIVAKKETRRNKKEEDDE